MEPRHLNLFPEHDISFPSPLPPPPPVESGSTSATILQIPIGIRTVYSLFTPIFPRNTPAPSTTRRTFCTHDSCIPGLYVVDVLQGFNSQSAFDPILGNLEIEFEKEVPKFHKITLVFELLADGIEIFLEKEGNSTLVFKLVDSDTIFQGIDHVNSSLSSLSLHRTLEKTFEDDFVNFISTRYELLRNIMFVTGEMNQIHNEKTRQRIEEWISIGNYWIEKGGEEDVNVKKTLTELVQEISSVVKNYIATKDEEEEEESSDYDSYSDTDSETDMYDLEETQEHLLALFLIWWDTND